MEQCIPHTTIKAKRNLPWINIELTKSMRSRNLAYRKAKRANNPNAWTSYRKKRNQVANELKRAKMKFFKSLDPSNPKSFWKATKLVTKRKSRIPVLKTECGKLISDDYEKAETMNKFFSDCFNTCEPPLAESDRHLFTTSSSTCPPEFLCTEEGILELLLSLDTTKANGPDDISATMLKATAPSIANGLMILFK